MRWLARLRSSVSSMLPVPLNSSKITWSMRDPVSMRAAARIARLPPPSSLGGGRRQDRQAAAFFELAGGAEEALGDFQSAGVDAAGHGAAAVDAADVEVS